VELKRFKHVPEFWENTQGYLLQNEAEHNLLLGIAHSLLSDPEFSPEPPYLAAVQTNDQILAVAICTAPYKLVLSKAHDRQALTLIAQDWHDNFDQLPGVSGLVPEVETFLQVWQTLTGQSSRQVMAMRIYQLTQVEPIATTKGYLRLALEKDYPLLLDWFTAFAQEVGEMITQNPEQAVKAGLKQQRIYLWEDSVPVSWASGSQSSGTARIGPVYTPPAYRRCGYATGCVAALSQKFLNKGCHSCFLFTDLANLTSNHIYRQIGYRPVCDWHDYVFVPQAKAATS
jgi:hypothetical protein